MTDTLTSAFTRVLLTRQEARYARFVANARKAEKKAKARADKYADKLYAKLGDAPIGYIENVDARGRVQQVDVVKVAEVTRTGIDAKTLEERFPAAYAATKTEIVYNRLYVL